MFGGFNPFPGKKGPQRPLGVIHHPVVDPLKKPAIGPCPPGAPGTPGVQGGPGIPPVQRETGIPPIQKQLGPTPEKPPAPIEAVWNGVLHGWSGYAKASRELIQRVSTYGAVRFADDAHFDPDEKESSHLGIYQFHRSIEVSPRAPRITFMPPPMEEKSPGYRVIYTMMETDPKVHPELIRIMNERYNECWTPTAWNAGTFKRSGLEIPIHVMPLGVDSDIYHSGVEPFIPKAIRMTGQNSGRSETPKGFLFINVFQPSFRKGHEVLIEVFEEIFGGDPEAGLILGTTAYSLEDQFPWKSMKSRIWTLEGGYSERQMAAVYAGCRAHVSTSRGEGWGLPTTECGAMGLPVIVPWVSSYPEIVPKGCGYFFEKDTRRVFPGSEKVSPWFGDGIEFPDYGKSSRRQLARLMLGVRKNHAEARNVGQRYRDYVASMLTWDKTAKKIADRLKEICANLDA